MSMIIKDEGEISEFESMPTEAWLYLSAVRYAGNIWAAGPSAMTKEEVVRLLGMYRNVELARIYAVKVPMVAIPAV